MDYQFTTEDLDKIEAGIREKYLKAAKSPEGLFKYPTGKKGLKALHYDKSLIDKLADCKFWQEVLGCDNQLVSVKLQNRDYIYISVFWPKL